MPEGTTRDAILASLIHGGAASAGIAVVPRMRKTDQAEQANLGARLRDIAQQHHIQPPTALAHLRRLEQEGRVARMEAPGGPRYVALPSTSIQWNDPEKSVHEQWRSTTPIDWRFPLITRVPDEKAQAFLLEWFDRAQAKDLLPQEKSRFEEMKTRPPTLHVLVYGSCARGDARDRSDIDMLLHSDRRWAGAQDLVDLAYEVSTAHPRPLNLQVVTPQELAELPEAFQRNIAADGKTVWCNDPQAAPLEAGTDR